LFDFLILRELFNWTPYYSQPNYQDYGRNYGRLNNAPKKKGNFVLNCFSFLFGDGNPNQFLQERRWQLIAQVIRENGGVVTAEQLAPFTDADPKNEDGVLPVLVRYDGRPEVTDTGNIVYSFPSLQVSAAHVENSHAPSYLKEERWDFSKLKTDDLVPVLFLATINLIGSWWLFIEAVKIPMLGHLVAVLVVLVIYGTLFVLVPCVRWFVLSLLNAQIDARNERRSAWAEQISAPGDSLKTKFKEVEQFKTKLKEITASDIIYSTDKDMLEQTFENEAKRLGNQIDSQPGKDHHA
jgi:hypothetical protein